MNDQIEPIQRKQIQFSRLLLICLSLLVILFNLTPFHGLAEGRKPLPVKPGSPELISSAETKVYLAALYSFREPPRAIHIPYFNGAIKYPETSVFWFGPVTTNDNSADVRLGYNNDTLWIRVSTIDRRLWYDPSAKLSDLLNWDAVSIYLDLDNLGNGIGDGNAYRFDAQLTWWEERTNYQAAYKGTSSGWAQSSLAFTTRSQWWGFPEPNDDKDDRAWKVEYSIPLKSLGLSGPPAKGSQWRLAVQIHDRDSKQGSPVIPDQLFPPGMKTDQPGSWKLISFGLPSYQAPSAKTTQTVSLRNGFNGITVLDGPVGGNTVCGSGLNLWTQWGSHAYPGIRDLNAQNQGNTDDWPCFSRVYLTFPLDSLPHNKVIVSATLILHQSGQSTGFAHDPPEAENSLIQVFEVAGGWNEATLSWNNAPLPLQNVSQAWVGSITLADLGKPRQWDISQAVANAYRSGIPLYIALYSADYYGPHGKYFFSSDSTDYNGAFRPQLDIILGTP